MSIPITRPPLASQPSPFSDPFATKGTPATQKSKKWQPKPVAPSPAPYDPNYENTLAALGRNRDIGLNGVNYNRSMLQKNYGFNSDGTENTTDPYSRLATLRADYERIKRGTVNNSAASGQLYAGSRQNMDNFNLDNQNRDYSNLKSDFDQQDFSLTQQQTGIQNDYTTGVMDAGTLRNEQQSQAVATGAAPVAGNMTRKQAVLGALKKHRAPGGQGYMAGAGYSPSHLRRLMKEAKKNGWIA